METRLRVGIIGLGVGQMHALGYARDPRCEVIGVCDLDEKKAQTTAEQIQKINPNGHPVQTFRSAEDLIQAPDIDAVSIATYDSVHGHQILKALHAGKHVFAEKPLCVSEEEARHIREHLALKPELKLSSNLVLRKSPRFTWLKQAIESGEFGKIYSVEGDYLYGRIEKLTSGWRGEESFYSVTYGGGIHVVDLILWLTGDSVDEVMTYGNAIATTGTAFRFNDFAIALLKFRSGCVAKISSNFACVHPHFHRLSVYGTQATFQNGLESAQFFKSRDPKTAPKKIDLPYPAVAKDAWIPDFVDDILGQSRMQISTDDIFASLSVCFAIEKSMQTGKPQKVRKI